MEDVQIDGDAAFADADSAQTEIPEGGEVQAEGTETPEVQQDQEVAEVPEFLKGTPFRTPDALVKSYKDIQRLVAAKDREIQQGKQYLIGLAKQMMATRRQQDDQGTSKKEADPNAFWPDFWSNPIAAIQKLATEIAENAVKSHLPNVEQNVEQLRNRAEVGDFLSRHPEFTPELETEMAQYMANNPWLQQVPDRLEIAYRLTMQARGQSAQARQQRQDAVKPVKQAAGMGGKRSTLPPKQEGDEFDEILASHRAERELYKLGRQS